MCWDKGLPGLWCHSLPNDVVCKSLDTKIAVIYLVIEEHRSCFTILLLLVYYETALVYRVAKAEGTTGDDLNAGPRTFNFIFKALVQCPDDLLDYWFAW